MLELKDTDWLNGYRNKTHIYTIYKKPTIYKKDTYRLKVRGWKTIFQANWSKRKLEYRSSYQTK